MKSLHQEFEVFHEDNYPNLKGAGLKALRRAFLAGYGSCAQNFHEIITSNTPREGMEKCLAIKFSTHSFQIDCE